MPSDPDDDTDTHEGYEHYQDEDVRHGPSTRGIPSLMRVHSCTFLDTLAGLLVNWPAVVPWCVARRPASPRE